MKALCLFVLILSSGNLRADSDLLYRWLLQNCRPCTEFKSDPKKPSVLRFEIHGKPVQAQIVSLNPKEVHLLSPSLVISEHPLKLAPLNATFKGHEFCQLAFGKDFKTLKSSAREKKLQSVSCQGEDPNILIRALRSFEIAISPAREKSHRPHVNDSGRGVKELTPVDGWHKKSSSSVISR